MSMKFYFTFGSWEKFPYKNTYLIVVASSYKDAVDGFRKKHPDIIPGYMNCSFTTMTGRICLWRKALNRRRISSTSIRTTSSA